jgi:hypothetical protein
MGRRKSRPLGIALNGEMSLSSKHVQRRVGQLTKRMMCVCGRLQWGEPVFRQKIIDLWWLKNT